MGTRFGCWDCRRARSVKCVNFPRRFASYGVDAVLLKARWTTFSAPKVISRPTRPPVCMCTIHAAYVCLYIDMFSQGWSYLDREVKKSGVLRAKLVVVILGLNLCCTSGCALMVLLKSRCEYRRYVPRVWRLQRGNSKRAIFAHIASSIRSFDDWGEFARNQGDPGFRF